MALCTDSTLCKTTHTNSTLLQRCEANTQQLHNWAESRKLDDVWKLTRMAAELTCRVS